MRRQKYTGNQLVALNESFDRFTKSIRSTLLFLHWLFRFRNDDFYYW